MSNIFNNHTVYLVNQRVFSLKTNDYIKFTINNSGYLSSRIKDKYGNTYEGLHQIIFAEANNLPKHLWPIDSKGKRYTINHIDENKLNNKAENLELISHRDNQLYNDRHKKIGKQLHNRKDQSKVVYQSKNGILTAIYPSASEAARDNHVAVSNIVQCCNGGFNLHGKWVNKYTIKGFNYSYTIL